MASPRSKKTAADREMTDFIGEQVSGEERTRHEREPLGFEDQMPGPVGAVPEEDPHFRPELSAHPYGGLPTHEGYDVDPETHFRRVRNMVVASIVLTVFVAGAWVFAVGSRVVPSGDPNKTHAAADEARALFDRQFSDISARLSALTGTTSTPTAAATASLNTALNAMRDRLSTAVDTTTLATSTPR
ncbi:hypothetical protein EPO33_03680 [Patescibacteria group bacterium]|nr:MAG: hypothetical protein EPO33_03680 [Patescibacteria group bacterium]